MKKVLSVFMLGFVMIFSAMPIKAGCPQGNGPCTGVCVGVYGNNGKISHYVCDEGPTSAPKDCTPSSDEQLPEG